MSGLSGAGLGVFVEVQRAIREVIPIVKAVRAAESSWADDPGLLADLVRLWGGHTREGSLEEKVRHVYPYLCGLREDGPFRLGAVTAGCAAERVTYVVSELWSSFQVRFPTAARYVRQIATDLRVEPPVCWGYVAGRVVRYSRDIWRRGGDPDPGGTGVFGPVALKAIRSAGRLRWDRIARRLKADLADFPEHDPSFLDALALECDWETNRAWFVLRHLATRGFRPGEGPADQPAPPRWARENEARDAWVYEQCCKGPPRIPYKAILAELKKTCEGQRWSPITSVERVRQIAKEYAKQHELTPPPPRQGL